MTDFAMSLATLRRAKGPEEVFGELPAASAGLRAEAVRAGFQVLARMLHPDRNGGSAEASEAMALLNAFRDQAEIKIKRGTWGQATSATSIAAGQTYVNVTPLASGDVCDVYIGDYGVGRRAVIKVSRSPRDRDLVENEAKVLGGLLAKHGNEAAHFHALEIEGGVDQLAITNVDRLAPGALPFPRLVCVRHDSDGPVYAAAGDIVETIEETLGVPVDIVSAGPTAVNKTWRPRSKTSERAA